MTNWRMCAGVGICRSFLQGRWVWQVPSFLLCHSPAGQTLGEPVLTFSIYYTSTTCPVLAFLCRLTLTNPVTVSGAPPKQLLHHYTLQRASVRTNIPQRATTTPLYLVMSLSQEQCLNRVFPTCGEEELAPPTSMLAVDTSSKIQASQAGALGISPFSHCAHNCSASLC